MYPNYFQQNFPINNQSQSNGFVSVRSEIEARNYPVGFGNSVTFKDETAPYIYVKTMGFSQMDTPRFEKFKLTKESTDLPQQGAKSSSGITLSDEQIRSEFEAIWDEINALKSPKKKKEVADES